MAIAAQDYNALIKEMTPVTAPADQQARIAALRVLVAPSEQLEATGYKLVTPTGELVELPAAVLALLGRVVEVLARGDGVTLVPVDKELTTQQCANILNVSRQYVVQLLDAGHIPHRRTGTHRRVRMEDLIAYKQQRDRARMASLDELTRLTEAFGGYEHEGSST